ncbi:MAG: response regulator [Elusimicrobia bacterium]|nr:response regulator [Elusimicrobiota bacterium]
METGNSKNRTILVVEDEPATREVLRRALEQEGYRVCLASDGEEAVEMLRRESTDVILLDLVLPGINGWEFCRAVRGEPALAHIPIIIITAKDSPAYQQKAFDLGANDYILKPFDLEEVKSRIAAVIQSQD